MSLDKPLEEITEADLAHLVESGTPELKTLDYKQSLPGTNDEERKEFFADVSSFANSSGGHLIYGMRAEEGLPVELIGLEADGDGTILRLESSIRDGIDPRIAGIHSTAVRLANSRTAIVMRIPKSFAGPHMVRFKNASRFYSRGSNGKYQLDVDEIRAAFLGSATTAERIRNFRLDRLSRIRSRETAVAMQPGPCAALHLMPLSAFGGTARYDVNSLKNDVSMHQALAPLFSNFGNVSKLNFDGLLVYNDGAGRANTGYLQLYRSGVVETVDASFLTVSERMNQGRVVPALEFEKRLFNSTQRILTVLKSLGIGLPLLFMLALIDVRGYALARDGGGFLISEDPFDRDFLAPQEVLIESYSLDVPVVLKPILDEIWNAGGAVGSIYYRDGKWVGK